MSLGDLGLKARLAIQEAFLLRRFLWKPDASSFRQLVGFSVDRGRSFPLDRRMVRNHLAMLLACDMPTKHRDGLLSQLESFLFRDVAGSHTEEWQAWIAWCRETERSIDALDSVTARALKEAAVTGRFRKVAQEDYEYLLGCYQKAYARVLEESGLGEHRNLLPLLREYTSIAQQLGPPASSTKHRDRLFSQLESFLFRDVAGSLDEEWRAWVAWCRQTGRPIDTLDSAIARALKKAAVAERFRKMPQEDYEYLLGCYQKSYARVLEEADPEERRDLLPVLLEYAGIAQQLGPNDSSLDLLRRWARAPERPRALSALSDEQAFQAPLRGVGSPNGVSLTIYLDPETDTPLRISCAGSTGDETLNAQIFTALFAAALACETEPTFVMLGGSMMTLDSRGLRSSSSSPGSLLSAVIGPGGPTEPVRGVPAVGMDAEDALLLMTDTFQRFQGSTGLVKVTRWDPADTEQLETRIRDALEAGDDRPRLILSDPNRAEPAGVVHAMPMLHRDADGKAVPVEIAVPYSVLGPRRVFELLATSRRIYMQRLIENAHRRKALAEKTFQEQDEAVRRWRGSSQERRNALCERQPWVTITHSIDFELGQIIPLAAPQRVSRLEYEEEQRPGIRDNARSYVERFTSLTRKLEELNQEGGRADLLSFKLLVDSMVRQATLPIPHPGFQEEYRKWAQLASGPVWALIEERARERGLSPRALAADNVVFNARLKTKPDAVILEPWVLIALHDVVVHVDPRHGTMEVVPAGKTLRLADALIRDGVTDLHSLHERFCAWSTGTLRLGEARQREPAAIESRILSDPKIRAALAIERAKRLLFRGEAAAARDLLQMVRKSDLAAAYFWAAVAHQAQFLEHSGWRPPVKMKREKRNEALLNFALNTLIAWLKSYSTQGREAGIFVAVSAQLFGMAEVALDPKAKDLLRQLQARDSFFVAALLEEQLNLAELEKQSLGLTLEQEERLHAAVLAVSSLECLNAAEALKGIARELTFHGGMTPDVKAKVEAAIRIASSLTYQDSPIAEQLAELARLA